MRTVLALLGFTFLLILGCATQTGTSGRARPAASPQPSVQSPPPVNLSGYSPAFKQGYSDGCASARGALHRDDARYRSDGDYMMGWSDGNSVCRSRR